MLTGSAPKRHSACLASAVERCFRLLPRDLRWSALSTLLEAQMITGKTAVSLVARGGTTDCAVSRVHNGFDAPQPHALLPCNLVSSGSSSVTAAGSQWPPVASGAPPFTEALAWWLSSPVRACVLLGRPDGRTNSPMTARMTFLAAENRI